MAEEQVASKKVSEAITRTLPFLRRYARAVTGSQRQGDEWVRLCAEVAVQQPELIVEAEDTKRGVFALFHRLRQPFGDMEAAASGGEGVRGRLKESLTDMAPMQRQVLLLTVLEGFTVSDAAHVLGVSIDVAERSLEDARRELQRVASVRILVIEDEAVIALDVADIVRNAGHEVVGIAATEKAAIELAKKSEKAGADGNMIVTPYYNKPTQAGILTRLRQRHFGRQPDHAIDVRPRDLRHRLPRAAADGQAGRTGLRDFQALRS